MQKLILLSLDRTPALDVITPGTLPAWVEAVTDGRVFDEERDAPRFQAAFRTLQRTCTQWPNPRQFLDALPPIPAPKTSRALIDEGSKVRVDAMLDDFAKRMRWTTGEGDA